MYGIDCESQEEEEETFWPLCQQRKGKGAEQHGCQMATGVWPFGLEELCLRYATLRCEIWIAPLALQPSAIQGKEGIKFCHLATLLSRCVEFFSFLNMDGLENSSGGEGSRGHANIGQASLNFDCTTREREKGKKKFRFMNEIRQKNCRPLAQNDPPFGPGRKF